MATLLTQKEYAERIGVSAPRVTAMKKRGLLVMVDTPEGQRVDFEATEERRKANTDPIKATANQMGTGTGAQGDLEIAPAPEGEAGADGEEDGEAVNGEDAPQAGGGDTYHGQYMRARAARAVIAAREAELQYKERAGKLVEADAVERAAFERAREVRDQLLAIPVKIAPALALEEDEHVIASMLRKEVAQVLKQLEKSFTGEVTDGEDGEEPDSG